MASVAQIPDDNIADIRDYKSNSLWRLTLRRVFRQRSAVVGLIILLVIVFAARLSQMYLLHICLMKIF